MERIGAQVLTHKHDQTQNSEKVVSAESVPTRHTMMNGLRLATSKCTRRAAVSLLPSRAWGTRNVHRRRPLPYSIEEGLGNFLPPQALKVVAEDYQEGLLERLNEQIASEWPFNISKRTVTETFTRNRPCGQAYIRHSHSDGCLPPPGSHFQLRQSRTEQQLFPRPAGGLNQILEFVGGKQAINHPCRNPLQNPHIAHTRARYPTRS